MDYLRTTREDKETFEILVWVLGLATACVFAAETDIFSMIKAKGLFVRIIEFLTTEVPEWIWEIGSSVICIVFLAMLRKGLPEQGKPVAGITTAIIVLECLGCFLTFVLGLFPESDIVELLVFLESIAVSILFIVLGTRLRKNYTGKVRTLGTIFLVYSILVLALFLVILAVAASGLDMEEDDYYDDADRIWQAVVGVVIIIIGTFVSIFPWWYESKLLIEGTKHIGFEDDSSKPTEYQSSDVSAQRNKDKFIAKDSSGSRKKIIIGVAMGCIAVGGIVIVALTGGNKGSSNAVSADSGKIPTDREVLAGDFDGDGTQDHVWIEGEIGDDGFAATPLVLRSDNPKLDGLNWNAPCGVMLFNLGRLDDLDKDFLGAIPYAMSDWANFEVYLFTGGKWHSEIEPFAVYLDSDEDFSNRVHKSNISGYITIFENDMAGEDVFDLNRSEVRLNRR